jgi:hypothetical protein
VSRLAESTSTKLSGISGGVQFLFYVESLTAKYIYTWEMPGEKNARNARQLYNSDAMKVVYATL